MHDCYNYWYVNFALYGEVIINILYTAYLVNLDNMRFSSLYWLVYNTTNAKILISCSIVSISSFSMEWQLFYIFLFYPASALAVDLQDFSENCQNKNTACDNHEGNLLESFPEVETLRECRELCTEYANCEFITYYGDNGLPIRNFCQLFRSCEKIVNCVGCLSEAKGCSSGCSNNVGRMSPKKRNIRKGLAIYVFIILY